MRLSNGYTRFTGIALVLGGILPVIGMAIRRQAEPRHRAKYHHGARKLLEVKPRYLR
jgi:hypothetical protein